ncbi:MAG: DUF3570 domain-containing protein [Burkholderiales bacterium]|nr:DUF3570 domain-containing protein [Burkholderiales bacterium]
MPAAAQAEAGGPGLVGFKWLDYRDWQPGLQRVAVHAPSVLLRLPLGERWQVEGSATEDSVSGASPRYHSAVSGASQMRDERRAGDLKVTRYLDRGSWTLGAAGSTEHDFRSRAMSFEATFSSEDNNRSVNLGLGLTRDRIGSTDDPSLHEQRRTRELSAGLTQVLSRLDLVQATVTLADGQGHFSDPYKRLDQRPASRHSAAVLLRWNHHVEAVRGTLRGSYRHYRDSFGIRSHTLAAEWVQPLSQRLVLTPSARLYSQRAAWFYYDPVYSFAGAPYPPGYFTDPPRYLSPDARLASFGAVTLGLKLALQLPEGWRSDLKVERYEQRSHWRVGGAGSPGLAPLRARFVQFGLSRAF